MAGNSGQTTFRREWRWDRTRQKLVPSSSPNRTEIMRAHEAKRRAEEMARQADPLEHAKTFLRRRGYVCFAARVTGGEPGLTVVGRHMLDKRQVLALAAQLGMIEGVGG